MTVDLISITNMEIWISHTLLQNDSSYLRMYIVTCIVSYLVPQFAG